MKEIASGVLSYFLACYEKKGLGKAYQELFQGQKKSLSPDPVTTFYYVISSHPIFLPVSARDFSAVIHFEVM
jgi:hypothetical protein